MRSWPHPGSPAFRGRARERQALDGLLGQVRGGESAVLVVRGEAGIGKTALMRYCARQAAGCRLAQIHGVESEMQLPLAALHQLCTPMLSGLDALPEPQQRALRVAFGLAAEPPPDLFVLGLAVLSLLAENAAARPLVCLVDDAQWLDEASSQVLGFVGRRLLAEPVGLLLAVREGAGERLFPGLPTLTIEGLTDEDAGALLTAAVPGHLDQRVCDRIVAETGGNPLGLLELASGMTEAELAGGFAGPRQASPPGHLQDRLHDHYLRRVRVLPEPAQQLMLLAAADPTGDATLLWRAAQTLGLGPDAAAAADAEQLLNIGSQVRFRHPLVRSAAYAAGSPEDRRAAHLTLAAATDARADPERRVWHLAAAATGPDEDVAAALEQAAAKIKARAGLAASAAFLHRSVTLTAEPRRHTERALAGRPREPARRRVRHRARPAGPSRSPRGRRSPAGPRGAAPRTGRVGLGQRTRGARAAAAGGQEPRITRCGARPRDLPLRLGGVSPRWSSRRARRPTAGGFPGSPGGPSASGGSAALRPPPRGSDHDDRPRAGGSRAGSPASSDRIHR